MARKKIRAKPGRKKIDIIVTCVCLYWVLFIIICFIIFWIKGEEPVTLITYGLGGSVIELVISGIIEVTRDIPTKNKDKKDEE